MGWGYGGDATAISFLGKQITANKQLMKKQKQLSLIGIVPAIALITFVSACATERSGVASSNVQSYLVQSGFKVKPAATPPQRKRLQSLPEHQFTVVRQHGENFYVWADKPNNRLYCGNEQAYQNYKESRKARREREEGAITWIEEPRGVPVTVFYGWAPFREW